MFRLFSRRDPFFLLLKIRFSVYDSSKKPHERWVGEDGVGAGGRGGTARSGVK